MRVAFTTVRRGASIEAGGEFVVIDWDTKRVVGSVPIRPSTVVTDPNPRGNSRGGRGIAQLGDRLAVASWDAIHLFDHELRLVETCHHPLMVGLHEISAVSSSSLWLSCTAIDAAILYDAVRKEVLQSFWPRELPSLQARWGLTPLEIEKSAPDQLGFLEEHHVRHPSHLHLNAVAHVDGVVYGLFNRFGAVVDLSTGDVIIERPELRGAHNLTVLSTGLLALNDTVGRRVVTVDLASRSIVSSFDLLSDRWVRGVAQPHDRRRTLRKILRRAGFPVEPQTAVFGRGLAQFDELVMIGMSPATLLLIDLSRGVVCDRFEYSDDVNCCVHGLRMIV